MELELFASLLLCAMLPRESEQGINERHLLHYLFKEKFYNPLERPVDNESMPLPVKFGIVLQQIIDVDEKNQMIYTNIWYKMKWKANNLVWDPVEFGGIKTVIIPAKNIWKPDVLLYNSANEAFDGTYHTNIVVSHDGSCLWVPPGMFKSTCSIDITWFPFDDQKCDLKFGTWSHDGLLIDLQIDKEDGADLYSYMLNGEWNLVEVPVKRSITDYVCCPEFYIDITYTIHIRRRTLYYGFNVIIPCLLISLMSLLMFLLPPDAGEKISLGVTILLSLMVFLLLVAERMPPTSDALPLIGIYFCCIMVMCSLSVLFTVIVLNFHHRAPDTHLPPPTWIRVGINGWLALMLRMKRPQTSRGSQSFHRSRLGDIQLSDRTMHSLLPNLLETEDEVRVYSENGMCGISQRGDNWRRPPDNIPPPPPPQEDQSKFLDFQGYASCKADIVAILRELKKVTTKIRRDDDDHDVKQEWKFAALVLDRMCFWMCLLFTGVSTVAILLSAPHLVA